MQSHYSAAAQPTDADQENHPAALMDDGSEKILIIEDEEEIAELLHFRMRRENYQVAVALDGRIACMSVEKDPPDLVILDIMLPEIDGWGVCQFIRSHQNEKIRSVPIIILSALSDASCRVKGLELGANSYITKPYSIKQLLIECKNQLAASRRTKDYQQEINQISTEKQFLKDIQAMFFHELRNHLAIISGMSRRLMKNHLLQDRHKDIMLIEAMNRSSSYLTKISENFSLFYQDDIFDLPRDGFEINEVVGGVVAVYSSWAVHKGIHIITKPALTLRTTCANRFAVEIILSNLLENAIKYTAPGGQVTVTAAVDGENGITRVRVTDTGAGIEPEEKGRIFDKYFRGEKARQGQKGFGLGLFTVKKLCDAIGAAITLHSQPGVGTAFDITLPPTGEPCNEAGNHQ